MTILSFNCWLGRVAYKYRSGNEEVGLLCVGWDVKPYSLTHHSLPIPSKLPFFCYHTLQATVLKTCHNSFNAGNMHDTTRRVYTKSDMIDRHSGVVKPVGVF